MISRVQKEIMKTLGIIFLLGNVAIAQDAQMNPTPENQEVASQDQNIAADQVAMDQDSEEVVVDQSEEIAAQVPASPVAPIDKAVVSEPKPVEEVKPVVASVVTTPPVVSKPVLPVPEKITKEAPKVVAAPTVPVKLQKQAPPVVQDTPKLFTKSAIQKYLVEMANKKKEAAAKAAAQVAPSIKQVAAEGELEEESEDVDEEIVTKKSTGSTSAKQAVAGTRGATQAATAITGIVKAKPVEIEKTTTIQTVVAQPKINVSSSVSAAYAQRLKNFEQKRSAWAQKHRKTPYAKKTLVKKVTAKKKKPARRIAGH